VPGTLGTVGTHGTAVAFAQKLTKKATFYVKKGQKIMFLCEKKRHFSAKKSHYRGGKFVIKYLVYRMLDIFSAITGVCQV